VLLIFNAISTSIILTRYAVSKSLDCNPRLYTLTRLIGFEYDYSQTSDSNLRISFFSFRHPERILGLRYALTFKDGASYIGRAYRYPPDVAFYIFFQQL